MVSKQVRKVEESKRTTDEELSAAREELGNVKDRKRDFDEGKAFPGADHEFDGRAAARGRGGKGGGHQE